jgi:uncharacterized membrane protein
MSQPDVIMPVANAQLPVVRKIKVADVWQALSSGFDDFWAIPTHVIFLSLIYPVIGLILGHTVVGLDLAPLLYPLATGFALLGPFAAIGLYELSRRREMGLDTSWRHALDIIHSPSFTPIVILGLFLVLLFVIWIAVAHAIYVAHFGRHEPETLFALVMKVVSTPEGHSLILVGNLVGAVFAVVAFMVSVVSFPLLLDRDVGVAVAVATSLRAVLANPVPMACWAGIIAAGLVIGSLPFLLGLAIVMPVLGHASWHLYRRVIEPASGERPEYQPPDKGRRYAADFPASLFTTSKTEPR